MDTQKITIQVEIEVPVGVYCMWDTDEDFGFDKCSEFDRNFNYCDAWRVPIRYPVDSTNPKKCQQCLDACKGGKI